MRPDVVVIGAGTAGLTAAARLAQGGARVLVLAKGGGAIQLAPATIDVLGYAPERVDQPLRAVEALAAERPDHPYALAGPAALPRAAEWLLDTVAHGARAPYRYAGSLYENMLLPTAVGALRPSALVPETMAAGDARGGGAFAIAGFRHMKDFHPALIAENLARAGVQARGLELDAPLPPRLDRGTLPIARALDDPAGRERVAAALAGRLRDGERLGLPAVLGLADPHTAWSELQERLGRPVFEIPTLPPSIPGIRLLETLRGAVHAHGGRVVMGPEVTGVEADGGHVTAVRARVSGGERTYPARWVVLATGGFASGGLELDADRRVSETVLGLPVAQAPAPEQQRFTPDYLGDHPLSRAGLSADARLRPLGRFGEPVYDNVLVAGATLGGAVPWKEKSGDGISLATGHRAAELILAELGEPAAAAPAQEAAR